MIPTTFPMWSFLVASFAIVGIYESVRFIGLYRRRPDDPRLRHACELSLVGGLYGLCMAVIYAQPSPEGAYQWAQWRFGIAAFFPYALVASVESLAGRSGGLVRRLSLVLIAIQVGGLLLDPALVVKYQFRIREVALLHQTFYDFVAGPLGLIQSLFGGWVFGHITWIIVQQRGRQGAPSIPALSLLAFAITGVVDLFIVQGFLNLPYMLEFGCIFIVIFVNRALLDEYFDLLQEKEKVEKFRNRLLTNISHELRTPLGVGLGYLELIERRGEALPEQEMESVRKARSALLEEAALIDELIDHSRFAAEDPVPDMVEVEINGMIDQIFQNLDLLARRKGVTLSAEIAPEIQACVDPRWFQLAVKNLVHNAIKFSKDGQTVRVEALLAENDELVIRVRDQGRGIPFQEQREIFERFVQGDGAARNDTDTGLGIGLALVRDVVLGHNGTINVFSRQGKGSTFEIRVPRNPDTETVED